MQEKLVAQKYAVRSRLLDAQDRLLEAERNLELTTNREQELKRELSGLEAEKKSFGTGYRQKMMEELLSVTRDRDEVNEQLQKADRRHKLVTLVSPVDAVVLDMGKSVSYTHLDVYKRQECGRADCLVSPLCCEILDSGSRP